MSRGLGRGFESLIPTDLIGEGFDPTAPEDQAVSRLTEVKISEVERDPNQPRKKFDEESLKELADSIKEHGVLQPLVVVASKETDGKKYCIVAGERRFRAAKLAKLKSIPVIIRTLTAQNRLELSIIENAQRADLNAIELATAYAKLKTQFNLTDKEIAKRVGKKPISIINTMRLLNLPDFAKQAMKDHNISEGTMRPLINADEKIIKYSVNKIVEEGWGARKVEQYVNASKAKSSTRITKKNLYARDERTLTKKYKTEVLIKGHSVRFVCKDDDALQKLLKQLGV